jgi:hypothetical protein
MPHITKSTDHLCVAYARDGRYTGIYCDEDCAKKAGERYKFDRLTVEDMNDDTDDELWEDGAEGPEARTPLMGHHCHNRECGALLWD